jgi:hypothetical protein
MRLVMHGTMNVIIYSTSVSVPGGLRFNFSPETIHPYLDFSFFQPCVPPDKDKVGGTVNEA